MPLLLCKAQIKDTFKENRVAFVLVMKEELSHPISSLYIQFPSIDPESHLGKDIVVAFNSSIIRTLIYIMKFYTKQDFKSWSQTQYPPSNISRGYLDRTISTKVCCTIPCRPVWGIPYHTSTIPILPYRTKPHTNTIIRWYQYGVRYQDGEPMLSTQGGMASQYFTRKPNSSPLECCFQSLFRNFWGQLGLAGL